jgi:hypothetical protein
MGKKYKLLLTFFNYRGIILNGESVFLENRTGSACHGLRASIAVSSKQGTLLDLMKIKFGNII